MRRQEALAFILLTLSLLWGCDLGETPQPDPQFVQIQFRYGFGNVVNTFDGTLTKDLVLDGSITVPFWFTTVEQELILSELDRSNFYDLPDTLHSISGVVVQPNPGTQLLRVRVNQTEKTVVWSFPPDQPNGRTILQLSSAIWSIIQSTPEYKGLPPARGGYI